MKGNKMTLIKRITLIALGAVLILSAGLVFLTSYTSWDAYYRDMLIKKERFNKEQEPEVTVMNGISVSIKDGVDFFKNGKATADKSNFVVNGLYTIGNEITKRDYEEELGVKDYDLTYPEDFTENGGELTFRYLLTEEVKDENGETVYEKGDKEKGDEVDEDGFKLDDKGKKIPVIKTVYDFTEKLTIELKDVKLDRLEVTNAPYIVAYAEGEKFSANGMQVNAVYNDGSKIENLSTSLLTYTKDALTTADTSVKIAYKYGEGEEEVIYGEVPVSVMSKNDFTNGTLKNLVVIGDLTLKVGQYASDLRPEVYALYSSGNYVKLDASEFGVTGFKGAAEFGKKYNLVVYAKDDPSVTVRKSLYPVQVLAADEATLNGATAYDGYVKDFDAGDYIEFVYNSATSGVVNLYLNMSNGYIFYENGAFVSRSIDLSDFAYISVNGKLKQPGHVFASNGPFVYASDALASYEKVSLGAFMVKAGENTIRINFKDSNSGAVAEYGQYVAGAIEGLEVSSQSVSSSGVSLGDYVAECKENSVTPSFTVTKEIDWGNFGVAGTAWTYATATDGDYLFFYVNVIGSGDSLIGRDGARIVKYDIQERKVVGYSALINYSGEANTPFFVRDGYIYAMASSGTFMRVPTSFTGNGTAKAEYVPSLKFRNEAGEVLNVSVLDADGKVSSVIKSAYYNHSLRKYALLKGNSVIITDANGNFEKSFSMQGGLGDANLAKITGDENYIYGVYKNNGKINPATTVYEWSGENKKALAEVIPQNSTDIMGWTGTATNIQSAAVVDGALYFTMLRWSNGNHTSVYKVSFGGSGSSDTPVTDSMDLYEYIAACEEKGVTPVYNKTALSAAGTLGYPEGMATDGKYIYVASKDTQMNVVVTKHEIATGKLVGKTAAFKRTTQWNNGEYITYMDGYVYIALDSGAVKRIKTDAITADGTAVVEDYSFTAEGLSGKITGFTYNALVNKLAVTAGDKVFIVGAKSMKVESSVACASSGRVGSGCDANYIYVLYEKNNAYGTAKFNVYDWSGNLVKSAVEIPNLISVQNQNNVQSMCVVNGEYYFLVSRWSSGGTLVKVTFDTSVLK